MLIQILPESPSGLMCTDGHVPVQFPSFWPLLPGCFRQVRVHPTRLIVNSNTTARIFVCNYFHTRGKFTRLFEEMQLYLTEASDAWLSLQTSDSLLNLFSSLLCPGCHQLTQTHFLPNTLGCVCGEKP